MKTMMIAWCEDRKTGEGYLVVSDDQNQQLRRVPWDEPISAHSDADEIADACGLSGQVDHDRQYVFVTTAD